MASEIVNDAQDHCAFIKKIILVQFIGWHFLKVCYQYVLQSMEQR